MAEIWDRIATEGSRNADAVHERLYERCAQLITQPRFGHRRDDLKPGLRCLNSDGFMIFYRYAKDTVGISRIVHHSRHLADIDFDAP